MLKNNKIINILCGISLLTISITTNAMQNNETNFKKVNENFNQQTLNQKPKTLNKSYSEELNNNFEKIDNSKKLNKTFDKKLENKNIDEETFNKTDKPKNKLNLKIDQEKLNTLLKNNSVEPNNKINIKNLKNEKLNKQIFNQKNNNKKVNKDYLIKVDNVFEKIKNNKKYNETPIKKTAELKTINFFEEEKINIYKQCFDKTFHKIRKYDINEFEKNFKTIISNYQNILKEYKDNFQENYKTNEEIKNIILNIEKQIFLKILQQIENLNLELINFKNLVNSKDKEKEFENSFTKIMSQYISRLKKYKKNAADKDIAEKALSDIILNIENEFKNYRINFRKNIAKSLKNNLENNILKKDDLNDKENVFKDYSKEQYENTIKTLDYIANEADILYKELLKSKYDLTTENINEKIKQYYEAKEKIKNFEFYNETVNYFYDIIKFTFSDYEEGGELYKKFENSYSKTMSAKNRMEDLGNDIFEIIEKDTYNDNKISNIRKIKPEELRVTEFDKIKKEYNLSKELLAKENIDIKTIDKNKLIPLVSKYITRNRTNMMSGYEMKEEYEELKNLLKQLNINIENINKNELIPLIFEYRNNKIFGVKIVREVMENRIKYMKKYENICENLKIHIKKIKKNEEILNNINEILSNIEKQATKENIEDMEQILNFLNKKFKNFEYVIGEYPDDVVYLKEIKDYIQKTKNKIDSLYKLLEVIKLKANLKKEKTENEKNISNKILPPKPLKFYQEKKEQIKEKMSLENDIILHYRGVIHEYDKNIDEYLNKFDLSTLKNFTHKSNIEKENYDKDKMELLKKALDLKNDHFKKRMFDLNIKLNEKNFSIRDFINDFDTKFAREYQRLNFKIGRILRNIKNYSE